MALEHRYYGDSQPFRYDKGGWTYENLKWLNVTQAIEDIELFVQSLKKEYGQDQQIVLIGGSYPGAVVAWFKAAHPDSVTAVWSSSGVIKAKRRYRAFDLDIFQATQKSSPECSQMILKITESIDKVFKDMDPH